MGAILVSAIGATACGASTTAPAHSATDQAAFLERTRCSADEEKTLAPVLDGATLESVRPLYSVATSGSDGPESRLQGVVVTVLAPAGVTDVWLDRALECHGARATLGHVEATKDDPFFLPGSPVDIDVRAARDGFEIRVNAYSTEDAHRIFARAEAFARARHGRTMQGGEATR
jgi:hypothetical protein